MAKQALTERGIASLLGRRRAAAEAGQTLGRDERVDGIVPGLTLRCDASGGARWTLRYRRPAGGLRRISWVCDLNVQPLAVARDRARDLLAQVRLGGDPGARAGAGTPLTLREAIDRFLEKRTLADSTRGEYQRMSDTLSKSLLSTAISAVTRTDVTDVLETLARTAPVSANRLYQLLRAVFNLAVREELIPRSPIDKAERPAKEKPRERLLSDVELAAFWKATEDATPHARAFVRVLILTGQRPGEAYAMRWRDLDLDAKPAVWSIPAGTRKDRVPHALPLSTLAVDTLKAIQPEKPAPDAHVFALDSGNQERWWSPIRASVIEILTKAEHKPEPFTLYDTRRTLRTNVVKLGTAPHVAERIIGHGPKGIQRVYDVFDYFPEQAAALQAWAAHVKTITSGKKKAGAQVVPMRRAAR